MASASISLMVRAPQGSNALNLMLDDAKSVANATKSAIEQTGYVVLNTTWLSPGVMELYINTDSPADAVELVHAKKCGLNTSLGPGTPDLFFEVSVSPFCKLASAPTGASSTMYIKPSWSVLSFLGRDEIYQIVSELLGEPLLELTGFLMQRKPRIRVRVASGSLDNRETASRIRRMLETEAAARQFTSQGDEPGEWEEYDVAADSDDDNNFPDGSQPKFTCFSDDALDAMEAAGAPESLLADDDLLCKVCYTNPRYTVVAPCGHMYMCRSCVMEMCKRSKMDKCAMCRGDVSDILGMLLW